MNPVHLSFWNGRNSATKNCHFALVVTYPRARYRLVNPLEHCEKNVGSGVKRPQIEPSLGKKQHMRNWKSGDADVSFLYSCFPMFLLHISSTLLLPIVCNLEGCTLTANEAHGVRFCPFEIVKKDLEERHMVCSGLSEQTLRNNLELVLREEEEWQQMKMYRRDTRFASTGAESTWEVERTVLDMLHCPMRMHEKVLNMLYQEILNGKTKNEVNGKPTAAKRKKKAIDEAAVGQEVAKLFTSAQGAPELQRGLVTKFIENGKNALHTITYDNGNVEDMNTKDFKDAHKLALLLETDKTREETRQLKQQRKLVAPALEQLSDVIRTLGSLGQTWTHQ
jgi:hypothetical protein